MKKISVPAVNDPVLCLPLKAPAGVDMVSPLRSFLKEKHSKEVATQHEDVVKKFDKSRKDAVAFCQTYGSVPLTSAEKELSKNPVTETSIVSNIYVYCVHLQFANRHFPLSDGNVPALSYTWKDAFSGKSSHTSANSFTDLSSFLFNAAALWSVMAMREPKTTSDGVKNAFQIYQQAAGVIEAVAVKLAPNYVTPGGDAPCYDIRDEGLEMSKTLLLTYANHCGYLKAMLGGTKQLMLSKMAFDVSQAYGAIARGMRTAGNTFNDLWPSTCEFFEKIFLARSHWHIASEVGQADVDIAECLARMRVTYSLLDAASRCPTLGAVPKSFIQEVMAYCYEQLDTLENLNSTVYTERIPKEVKDPVGIGKSIAKPSPLIPLMEATQISADIFQDIVPLHVMSAAITYKEQLTEKVKAHIRSVHAHREKIRNGFHKMGALGLIEALDAASRKDEQLPATLEHRLKRVHADGGLNAYKGLVDSVSSIKQLADLCRGVVVECTNQIAACPPLMGNNQDTELEQAYYRATQLASEIQQQVDRLASQEDKIKKNEEGLTKISWSLKDIAVLMPTKSTDLSSKGEAEALNALLQQLRTAVSDLGVQEEVELNGVNDLQAMLEQEDLTNKLAALPQIRHQSVLEATVKRYSDVLQQLSENAQKSAMTFNNISRLITEINTAQKSNIVNCQRAAWINELDVACSTYHDLRGSLKEISSGLTQQSTQVEYLKENVDSIVAVRKMQYEEAERTRMEEERRVREEQDRRTRLDRAAAESKQRQDELKAQLAQAMTTMESAEAERKRMVEEGLRKQQLMMQRVQEQQRQQQQAAQLAMQQQQQQQMAMTPWSMGTLAPPSYDQSQYHPTVAGTYQQSYV
eukprot:PhF_6_TR18940/c1_g1_i1/m.27748/K12200/PDCD6IP, ALIX, RIM20; programmed cell death 6-interacting protein